MDKQVDVLPSKNQMLCTANLLLFNVLLKYLFMSDSCEPRLITKEHIAMHTNLIPSVLFKPALYSRNF